MQRLRRLTGGPANTSFVPYTELSATTGLDGSFEIQRVRPGAYTLSLVSAPFFTPKSVVVVDKDVKGIEVVAPWTIEVTGKTAVEGNLGPVPQFSVMFTGAGRQTTSYQSGQGFRTTLGEGFYAVTVIGLPSGFYLKAMEADSTDLTTNPLHVGKDQPVASITVTVGVSSPSPWGPRMP